MLKINTNGVLILREKIDTFNDTITSYEKCNFFDFIFIDFYQHL